MKNASIVDYISHLSDWKSASLPLNEQNFLQRKTENTKKS